MLYTFGSHKEVKGLTGVNVKLPEGYQLKNIEDAEVEDVTDRTGMEIKKNTG